MPVQTRPLARPARRRQWLAAATVACTFTGAALVAPGAAVAGDHGHGHGKPRPDVVQQTLDRLVDEHGVPGALATVTDRKGRERHLVAGVGDLATGAPVPVDGQVRIGSDSKTFLAAVVLQLVGEGVVDLDAPVETYLPGVVHGEGVDGTVVTVRDLLQHTSGIGDYTSGPPFVVDGAPSLLALKDWYVEPYELVDLGLARPATPHGTFAYSNTNYVLAGLVVQRVTQRPLGEVVTERIIEPLGLAGTYVPGRGEQAIRGAHPDGHHAEPAGSGLFEHTDIDPSSAWAAGDIVSTPSDVTAFFRALLGGKVLQPAELAEMTTTIPMGMGLPADWRYGLGLMSMDLSCGGQVWGHGGTIPGYQVEGGVSQDGRRGVTVATTTMHGMLGDAGAAVSTEVIGLVDTVLCS
ncbi:serine hydrolase domain-containing protein [Cellulomonas wangsupingiae]|uniref:serine hydrolase domain-containing protein n=1 Tax=Cellulomonas wangsupingiae TaxID=2968085 RepID=UPI001D0F17A4|nr:serine hydrolase domain-containing protein [Cellulomonas wangsupingiae]MCM0640629.1 beta-lactamase family protein [Cellulomonas wangsupingiae]